MAAVFVPGPGFGIKRRNGIVQAVGREHQGRGRQVIEQGGGFVKKQRQVVLDARRRNAVADILVHRGLFIGIREMLEPAVAEAGAGILMPWEFMGRQQFDLLDAVDRTLGFRIEGAQGFDFIIEQVNPVGQVGAHGIDVQDRSTYRVFTMLVHIFGVVIAGGFQLHAPAVDIQVLADFQQQGVALQVTGWRQPVHQGAGRDHQYAVPGRGQAVQGADSPGGDVLVWRE